ncbi:redoxin domain-containing protein [Glycomyces sp. NPDC047010]|uniref:redoxin domain-containing protein n=1 Tax=Glycomyces sp. NPDC047010 TaxID=3155023 RepID=UPI00340276A5
MLDFWAYSCINCQRDEPYLSAWYDAYRDAGLEVIGVHSPEFAFEKDAANVADAIEREGIAYPVVQDNDLATWSAYRNRYWPAKYLIDESGTVRAIKFGEGSYEQTETLLRELLHERDPEADLPDPVTDIAADDGEQLVADPDDRSPEMYLSRFRQDGYDGPAALARSVTEYTLAQDQRLDTYSIGGAWEVDDESITTTEDAQSRVHFHAANVYHVLEGEGTVTVSREGEPDTVIEVSSTPNLYPLIQGDEAVEETITISYSPDITAYTFTFG